MRRNTIVYTIFSLLIALCMGACKGGESGNSTSDSTKILDSLKKVSAKVDTTSEEFKASAIVMYSPYAQHIPHFDNAEVFTPTAELKGEVAKHSETCKDESKQEWKKNKAGFMKCFCEGAENYVIFSPKGEWAYTRHLTRDKKLADFQPILDKEGLKFDSVGINQVFKVVITRGSWYEIVNNKTDAEWWFDKNMGFIKFID